MFDIITSDALSVYHNGFDRKLDDVTEVTIHGTGGGHNADAMIRWISGGEFHKNWSRGIGLFHFLIDRDGSIYNFLGIDRWAYHSHAGMHDMRTIGVELLNQSPKNADAYTDEQYSALKILIVEHIAPLCPGLESITSHDYNCRTWSGIIKSPPPCPGPGFNWARISNLEYKIKI